MRLRLLMLICLLPGFVLPNCGGTLPVDDATVCDADASTFGWTMLPPSRTLELIGGGSVAIKLSPAFLAHLESSVAVRAKSHGLVETLQTQHMRLQV